MPIRTDLYIENCLKIRTKAGDVVPLKMNHEQRKFYDVVREAYRANKPIRIIALKARQVGISTVVSGIISKECATSFNKRATIVAHREDASTNLLAMHKRFYDNLPVEVKPQTRASNAKEIIFDTKDGTGLHSNIRCYTAGADSIGRSDTIQYLHVSEYAFWGRNKEDILLGLLQSVPKLPDTIVVIESTANGFDDFRSRWYAAKRGESDYIPFFVAWWEHDEYRDEFDGTPLTEDERALKAQFGLDDKQIQWRRNTIRNECGGDLNRFKQEYPASDDEAFIATGDTYFDKVKVVKRLTEIEQSGFVPKHGYFACVDVDSRIDTGSIRWVDDDKGAISLFIAPEVGIPYVIGGDTAGAGSDAFTGICLDNRTGAQVAAYKCVNVETREYVRQMMCLGYYYNNALIAIENNFDSYSNTLLQQYNYSSIYMRRTEDRIRNTIIEQYGWHTDVSTRQPILDELNEVVNHHAENINDIWVLREMLVFIKNALGKATAANGEHDDLIMAFAIANHVRPQQRFTEIRNEPPRQKTFLEQYKGKLRQISS